eukprot:9601023-Heterocapsa_arctica.AAC.1
MWSERCGTAKALQQHLRAQLHERPTSVGEGGRRQHPPGRQAVCATAWATRRRWRSVQREPVHEEFVKF